MKSTGKCTSLFAVLVALVALAAFTTPAVAASDNQGTALTQDLKTTLACNDGVTVATVSGEITSSASAAPAEITLSVDGAAPVQIGTIQATDWVHAGRTKRYYFNASYTVDKEYELTYCFTQPGSDGRDSKQVCYTTVVKPLPDCSSAGCTLTQGYWKTHGPIPTGNNSNEWLVTSLSLGSVSYTDLQLLSILNQEVAGNGLIALAHQLIAAKLNILAGASNSAVADDIAAADALIGGLVVPPVGTGYLSPSTTSGLTKILGDFNSGVIGPGHCAE